LFPKRFHQHAHLKPAQDLRFLRQTQLGIYNEDDCEGVHPDTIQEYYGTTQDRVQHQVGQTGAGHPPEELDLVNEVVQDQDLDIRHDSIPTADHEAPPMPPEHLTLFLNCLASLQNDNQGDLLHSVAGELFVWDPVEVMKVGRRRQKELVISLVDAAWERRALIWLAAIRVLDSLL
jgi:hypothetical protein